MERDIPLLMDAICEGWSKCLQPPYGDGSFSSAKDSLTDCNRFVHFVCNKLGYTKFLPEGATLPILANQMFDYLVEHPDEWKEVDGKIAQWHANVGAIVIAAWKHPEGAHGHVCIVRPGRPGSSGKWNSDEVPKVANVSTPDLCHIDRAANYAFGTPPKYFALKSLL